MSTISASKIVGPAGLTLEVNGTAAVAIDANGSVSLGGTTLSGSRNRVINGKMEIAQRGATFAAVANATYMTDRFRADYSTTGVVTATQQADAPPEFQNSLRLTVTTADAAIAATDFFAIGQVIEGYNIRDLVGKPFTLSFWVRSAKAGVHTVSLRSSNGDRSYVAEYNVVAANTWEYKTATVVGGLPSSGTWNFVNGSGLLLNWTLMAGTNFNTTPGAWQTVNTFSTSNQVNVLDTVGNVFAITGVQLEAGATATPFEHRHYGFELSLCQRYYETLVWPAYYIQGLTSSTMYYPIYFKTVKRATPTITLPSPTNAVYNTAGGNSTPSTWTTSSNDIYGFAVFAAVTAGGITGLPPSVANGSSEL